MERNVIISKLESKIKKLSELKRVYEYKDEIISLQKELKKVCNCIKKGGTLSDIQKIGKWNFTAYLKISVPCGMSLKQYTETISNNVETAKDVNQQIVYVDYMYKTSLYI